MAVLAQQLLVFLLAEDVSAENEDVGMLIVLDNQATATDATGSFLTRYAHGAHSRNNAGFSLVEVMFSASILSVLVAAAASAMITSSRRDILTREDGAATYAARAKIAEIRRLTITQLFTTYDNNNRTFSVQLLRGQPAGSMGLVVNGIREPEGEIIFITSERPDEADYGRDLSPADGQPDGVDLDGNGAFNDVLNVAQADGGRSIFPIDLNGNGTTTDTNIAPANLQLLPVVVVIRWRSRATNEERRVQMMTVISQQ